MSMKAGDTSARRRRRRCSELSRARVECELASQLYMCEPRESVWTCHSKSDRASLQSSLWPIVMDALTQYLHDYAATFLAALSALQSHASSSDERRGASDWLIAFQSTHECWEVAKRLLMDPATPVDVQVRGGLSALNARSTVSALWAQQAAGHAVILPPYLGRLSISSCSGRLVSL